MKFTTHIPYQPKKEATFSWDSFRKGLNTLLRDNEIDKEELAQMDNLLLIGRGVPKKRWGTLTNFTPGSSGAVRGLGGFYKSDGTNELLAITDDGYLYKKSGTGSTLLAGVSFASGNDATMAQLNNTMYIANGQRALVKYSSPTLVGFVTLALPVITGATNLSNATGTTIKSYRISAIGTVGETLGSVAFTLASQPASLGGVAGGTLRLFFTGSSGASLAVGYNVYGRESGLERFIASLPAGTATFDDDGAATPAEFTFPPTADSTQGPTAKYVIRYQDRLIFAGFPTEPSKVLISGRSPYNERFDIGYGGNFINIEQDAGDNITGLRSFRDRIIVFKQRSIWQVTLTTQQIGNFFVTEPVLQLITASYGCIAPKSIIDVENDMLFVSRDGVNSLGYQSGFAIDVLRSNIISTKIRPFFDALTTTQKKGACAIYFKKKYILAIPGIMQSVVFDTERGAWVGPWTVDGNCFTVWTDANNDEHLLFGNDTTTVVDEYSQDYSTDNSVAIATTLKTRQEDFGAWEVFKSIRDLFFNFRNVFGTVMVSLTLEKRDGSVVSATSFTLTQSLGGSGWGAGVWGTFLWGENVGKPGAVDVTQIIKWIRLNKSARFIQIKIVTTGANDLYELLGIKGTALPIGKGINPSTWLS